MRPKGISFLAFLSFLAALVYGVLALGPLGFLDLAAAATPEQRQATDLFSKLLFTGGTLFGAVLVALAVVSLAMGVGLWTLKNWARLVAIVLSGIAIVVAVPDVYSAFMKVDIGALLTQVISIGIDAVILAYLFTPRVKEAFGVE